MKKGYLYLISALGLFLIGIVICFSSFGMRTTAVFYGLVLIVSLLVCLTNKLFKNKTINAIVRVCIVLVGFYVVFGHRENTLYLITFFVSFPYAFMSQGLMILDKEQQK